MNKKGTLLQAYARVKRLVRRSRAPGCDNNVISSVEEHREEKSKRLRSAGESFKFSAEVARCRDTDCKRYRLSKFGETVSRRSGGVSEGNFHPLRVYSFSACERSTARLLHPLQETRDSGHQLSARHSLHPNFISTESEAALRRHFSRSSNSTGNLTMPKVVPIKRRSVTDIYDCRNPIKMNSFLYER